MGGIGAVIGSIAVWLGFGLVGSWIEGWSGMPLGVSVLVWCFFVLVLVVTGVSVVEKRYKARRGCPDA